MLSIAKDTTKTFNPADVFWLREKEGANTIQVAETIAMCNQATLAAVGARKLFVIADASNLTLAAQNKLLKTIEEPREDCLFLFLATSEEMLLPTIKSRCQKIFLQNTDKQESPMVDVAKKLSEAKTIDEALPHIAVLSKKETINQALVALGIVFAKKPDILGVLAVINRNIMANCNATNALDLLVLEMFK